MIEMACSHGCFARKPQQRSTAAKSSTALDLVRERTNFHRRRSDTVESRVAWCVVAVVMEQQQRLQQPCRYLRRDDSSRDLQLLRDKR